MAETFANEGSFNISDISKLYSIINISFSPF